MSRTQGWQQRGHVGGPWSYLHRCRTRPTWNMKHKHTSHVMNSSRRWAGGRAAAYAGAKHAPPGIWNTSMHHTCNEFKKKEGKCRANYIGGQSQPRQSIVRKVTHTHTHTHTHPYTHTHTRTHTYVQFILKSLTMQVPNTLQLKLIKYHKTHNTQWVFTGIYIYKKIP